MLLVGITACNNYCLDKASHLTKTRCGVGDGVIPQLTAGFNGKGEFDAVAPGSTTRFRFEAGGISQISWLTITPDWCTW